jgi:hypothetical protein
VNRQWGAKSKNSSKRVPELTSRNNSQNGEVLAPNIQMPKFGKVQPKPRAVKNLVQSLRIALIILEN